MKVDSIALPTVPSAQVPEMPLIKADDIKSILYLGRIDLCQSAGEKRTFTQEVQIKGWQSRRAFCRLPDG